MKKIINRNILKPFVLFGLIATVFFFASCEDEEATGSPIGISAVYLQDVNSTVQDRVVSFGRLGQLLRIEGFGFTGISKIYINAFEIRDSAPSINNISNTLPNAGEEITVFGTGLIEVSKVIFPGNIEVTTGITFDEEDGEFFTVTVPSGIPDSGGPLLVETANGRVYSPSYFSVRRGLIIDFDGTGSLGEFGNTIRQDELQSASMAYCLHLLYSSYYPCRFRCVSI